MTIKRRKDLTTIEELKQDIEFLEKHQPENLAIQFLKALLERKLREESVTK